MWNVFENCWLLLTLAGITFVIASVIELPERLRLMTLAFTFSHCSIASRMSDSRALPLLFKPRVM